MKLAIGVPCFDHVAADFAISYGRLTHVLGSAGIAYYLVSPRGTAIPKARNGIVREALKADCTDILWLDSDMVFDGNVFFRLKDHAKPIVCAYGVRRQEPISRCGEPLDGWTESGLCEMRKIGMGVCLTSAKVFEKIKEPWFEWNEATDYSEDTYFSMKARAAGLKLWCDVDLSKSVGHFGGKIYRP